MLLYCKELNESAFFHGKRENRVTVSIVESKINYKESMYFVNIFYPKEEVADHSVVLFKAGESRKVAKKVLRRALRLVSCLCC